MQVLLRGRPVQDQTTKDVFLEILADRYSRAILESTMEMPKSAIDLSNDCGIPISTAYRRVQVLHKHKLLGISGSINEDGKKYFLYKSKVKSIMTCFNNGSLEVEIVPNSLESIEN
jgi:predicted transcriptional regulator